MEQIARAAGVSRQTIYAHFPSRDALLQAVTQHLATEAARHLDALDLDGVSAVHALGRWVDAGWALLERYPVLLTPAIVASEDDDEQGVHEPIIGLGHAAGREVTAGRMTPAEAGVAFRESVLKMCRASR